MKAITRIELENFQSHKRTILDCNPGTNVIIGQSDVGKSAVLRAINWVVTNRPLGEAYRSDWGGTTRVALHIGGHLIERIRGPNTNVYVLDGQVLSAFGTEVPDDVQACLGIDEANIHSQGDVPFLLGNTPGDVAKRLNSAASIGDIDQSIARLQRTTTSIRKKIDRETATLEEYTDQLVQFADLDEQENQLINIESTYNRCCAMEQAIQQVSRLLQRYSTVSSKVQETDYVPPLHSKVQRLLGQHKTLLARTEEANSVENLLGLYGECQSKLALLTLTSDVRDHMHIISRMVDDYNYRHGKTTAIERLLQKVTDLEEKQRRLTTDIATLQEEYTDQFPDQCPLCGNVVQSADVVYNG